MDEAEKSTTIDNESDKSTQQDKKLFLSVKFFLAQCNNSEDVKNLLISNGASHINYLTERVTHAISDIDCPEAEEAVELFDKPVVNSSWIHMSLKANKLLPTVAFSPFKTIFHDIVVSFSSDLPVSDIESLAASLTFYGAHVTKEESVSTHFIAASAVDSNATSERLSTLKVVGPDWIMESIRNKRRLDEQLFDPKLLLPPPPPTPPEPDPEPEIEPLTKTEQEIETLKPPQLSPRHDPTSKVECNTKIDNNSSQLQSHMAQTPQKVYPLNFPHQTPRLRLQTNLKVPQPKFRPSTPVNNSPIVQRPPIQQTRLISQDPQQPKKVIISYGQYRKMSPNQNNVEYISQQQQQQQPTLQHHQVPSHHQPRQLTHVQPNMHQSPHIQHQPMNQQIHQNHQAMLHHNQVQHGPNQQLQPNQNIVQRQPMIQQHMQHQQLQHQPVANHQPAQQNQQILEQQLIHQPQPIQQQHSQHSQHIHQHQQISGHGPMTQHQPIHSVQSPHGSQNQHIIQYHPSNHPQMPHQQQPHPQQQQQIQPVSQRHVPINQAVSGGLPNMMHHQRVPQPNMYNQNRPQNQFNTIQRGPLPQPQNPQQMMNRFQEPSYQNTMQPQQINIPRQSIYYNQNPNTPTQTRHEQYSPQKSSPTSQNNSYNNNIINQQPPPAYMQPNLHTPPIIQQQQQKLPLQQQQQIDSPSSQVRHNSRQIMPVNNQMMIQQSNLVHQQQQIQPYPSLFDDTKPKVPAIDPPRKYYGHDADIKVPENQPFFGCCFKIIDYNEQTIKTKVVKAVRAAGGTFGDDLNKLTHLICENRLSETYDKALSLGVRCVTVYWINDILAKNKLTYPWRALHLPVTFSQDNRPLCNEMIAITNISDITRRYVKEMILKTGARYTSTFSPSNTLLVCGDVGGEKYEHAVDWRTPIANCQLLTDYLLDSRVNHRFLLSEPKYQIFKRENHLRICSYDAILDLMKPWEKPIKLIDENKIEYENEKDENERLKGGSDGEQVQVIAKLPSTDNGEQNNDNNLTNEECKSPRISLNSNDSGIMTGGSNMSESDVSNAKNKPADQTGAVNQTTERKDHVDGVNQSDGQIDALCHDVVMSTTPPPETTNDQDPANEITDTGFETSLANESSEKPKRSVDEAISVSDSEDVIAAAARTSTEVIRLMFTHLDSNVRVKLEVQAKKLGMDIAAEPTCCTHLIVDQVVRTPTFICAFNYAKHILSHRWISESHKRGQILDESPFVIKDKNGEAGHCLDLAISLLKRDRRGAGLFKDYIFFVTPSVLPSVRAVKEMIESAGGVVVTKKRPSYMQVKQIKLDGNQFVAVTCQSDIHLCASLIRMGVDVLSVEFVLSGILRQEIEFEQYRLDCIKPNTSQLEHSNINTSNDDDIPLKRIKKQ